MRVIGVAGGEIAQRRLTLDVDKMLIVVHLKYGFGRIDDLPNHHRGNLNRIAVLIVDFQLTAFEVADSQRYSAASAYGDDPPESLLFERALVRSEQLDHFRLIRIHDGQSEKAKNRRPEDKE